MPAKRIIHGAERIGGFYRIGILSDHIDFPNLFVDGADALPSFREERQGIWLDFDDFTGFVLVGTATTEEVAVFIASNVAGPAARCADPDTAFGPPIRLAGE